jgi:hypothetical protein
VIVVTDGSRILGLGDLGANGMGISGESCRLLRGGWHCAARASRSLDVGTNNEDLLNDKFHLAFRRASARSGILSHGG